MKTAGINRNPAFAGQFYPATKSKLNAQLDELFIRAKKNEVQNDLLRAIISPHAGYIFSGEVAASAFNQIDKNTTCERVFVLASSHQFHFAGAAVFSSGDYNTPLGKIKVDTKLAQELLKTSELFCEKPEAHQSEHSLEVQLPFLQHKLGDRFTLVPIILGTNNPEEVKEIATILKPWFTSENLFIISTDFSHYPDFEDAGNIDADTANAICSNNPKMLLDVLENNNKKNINNLSTSLCGWTSVLTLLYLTENEKLNFRQIHYKNSGCSSPYGNKQRVVGYWAISVSEERKFFRVTKKEREELLFKARQALKNYILTGSAGQILPPESDGILREQTGVFVSVYVDGKLRGCVGNFGGDKSLNDLVQTSAVSAAKDSRFDKIHSQEIAALELEISVLSPLKKINSTDEIELGKHGIYIKKGENTGTFLPQVAKKTGWNLDEFLGHCSREKAGIGWDGWKKAELFIYEAYIFRGK